MLEGRRCLRATVTACAALLVASNVWAQGADRLAVRGFGGWALGDTGGENSFGYVAQDGGEWNNHYAALNVAAQPLPKLSLRAQGFWGQDLRGDRVSADYLFAEWAQSPALRVRAGKVLTPFGIYSETYDVGTVRPFYLLPQFYAGPLGLIPKAYLGAGVTGVRAVDDRWELQYDAFGGEIAFDEFSVDQLAGVDAATGLPRVRTVSARLIGSQMVGGRLLLAAPATGFDVGGTVFHAGKVQQRIGDGPRQRYPVTDAATFVNARVQYQRDALAGRAEWFGALADDADVKSFYLEGSYRFARRWQVAAQYERSHIALEPGDDSVPDPLRRHRSLGLALNYWVSPRLVLKLNGYSVDGNMIARPEAAGLKAVTGTIDESTTAVVVGAQFAF